MRGFMRLVAVGVSLVVLLAVVVFVLENQQPMTLVFMGWSTPALSSSVPLIAAFLLGMVIGPILGLALHVRSTQRNRARAS